MGFVEPAVTPAAEPPAPAVSPTAPAAASPSASAADSPVPAAEPPAARLSAREERRPRDMIMSLLVLLVPIALFLTFYRVVLDGDQPIAVDPTSSIELATREFPVARPAGLGDDWHVTSANFRREDGGATLRLGYVDPDAEPILLIQSTIAPDVLVPAEVGAEGKRTGAYRTGERTWMRYTGRKNETALILTEQPRTIVIIGNSADTTNLEKLAAAL
ncbi:uncharacterized protein DUF4245 [Actinoplanes xinjiangensis]|uniref:Uncharacterized protein DUF4245 n=1 Tax=Actinoplanes xinjiangensis TaxID=512350 RepID=A0A316EE70_9ACTN|nr:uncharacterized protein DUF4245 [Actinoplanes xinjiangensis]GIF43093.1 hypothetical protein Axi01nite_74040 [Actinoplanes xinjiangensis]